jgi:CheY-like chemotaxis protein/DNA-directed RNA polymerase specialized sigma24 family protein
MPKAIADLVSPQLPYLRRFARALTGSQEAGDAYVVAMLEALIAEPTVLSRDLSPRVAAYQALLKVWSALPINARSERIMSGGPAAAADRRIEMLTPLPRLAFLLAAVEEFPTADIATILGKNETEVVRLIDTAGCEISEQLAVDALIIEDEPLIALDIETLASDLGLGIIGIAATREEAATLARRSTPGLILADIQLADGSSGIDAVNDILVSASIPVIFITAYPERLLTGERAEPTFLITKPFKPEMVKAVISQALFFDIKAARRRGAAA